jgi:hypothetical protein
MSSFFAAPAMAAGADRTPLLHARLHPGFTGF